MTEPSGYNIRFYAECAPEAADEVARLFIQETGADPVVELTPSANDDVDTPARFEQAVVSVYLNPAIVVDQTQQKLDLKLHLLAQLARIGPLQRQVVRDEDWATAWKKHYHPIKIGSRIVICPTWHTYQAASDEVMVRIDPGLAFGTGIHPTTQMCVGQLERWSRPGDKVIDVGTGSGILSLCASALGAGPVVAIEMDPVAVSAARANFEQAGVMLKVRLVPTIFEKVEWEELPAEFQPPYDLALANLTAQVIVANSARLLAPLKPAGILIASGIIIERESDVIEALGAASGTVVERHQQADWVCLVVRKA